MASELERWFPPRGPCALCGHADARHRLFDAIADRSRAGEAADALAEDYGLPVGAVRAVIDNWVLTEVEDDT